jgi:hypothetical protein
MSWGTAKQVSQKFAIPLSSVYRYTKTGELPHRPIGGRKKYPMDKIEREWNKGVRDNANSKVW